MHIVFFQGGFANQLFQYCFYERLKTIYGKEAVYADISHYLTNNDHGGFKLDGFFDLTYIDCLPQKLVEIDETNYENIVCDEDKDYLYRGYWQSTRYLPENIRFLDALFSVETEDKDNEELFKIITTMNSVSIHIRRGDYLDNYMHGNIATIGYIYNSIAYIESKISDPVFIIFSDDIKWCENNIHIQDSKAYFAKGNRDCVEKDIVLMSLCKHNIISNSSFSWWAQRLNKNPDKIVISPEYWFNEQNNKVNLIADDFVKVKNTRVHISRSNTPFFSIIIVTRNDEMGTRRCLVSILSQPLEDIEVIIVDDESIDSTSDTLKEYAMRDVRVRLLKNDKKRGMLSSVREALGIANGRYVLVSDSKGYYTDECFEDLRKEIDITNGDLYEFGYISEPEKRGFEALDSENDEKLKLLLKLESGHKLCAKCFSICLAKRLVEETDDYFCDYLYNMYFSSVAFSLANKSHIIKRYIYHQVESQEWLLFCDAQAFIDDYVLSVSNVRVFTQALFAKHNKKLKRYLNEGIKTDMFSTILKLYHSPISTRERMSIITRLNVKMRGRGVGKLVMFVLKKITRRIITC